MTSADKKWLTVVGVGDDGLPGLGSAARGLIDEAEVFVGGARHLAMLPQDGRDRLSWPKPFNTMNEKLAELSGRRVCVLASGDPCCHGVGAVLARRFDPAEMLIVPAPSAYSLACARLGWSMPQVDTLSVHGRPLERLHPFLQPGAKLLLLSENGSTPAKVAALLRARGFGTSRLTVLSHLGGDKESIESRTAEEWIDAREVAPLNTIAIECEASPGASILARTPGLPDEAYDHDGQLTKREVRAITLSSLGPWPGQHLWDVGAGCGSIAIEWMRHDHRCRATAIEPEPQRVKMLQSNALALGTPELTIKQGRAPAALEDLTMPDAVFVGGGISEPGLIETCWDRLGEGGRLVANAVSLEGETILNQWQATHGGQLIRIAVERAGPIGRFRAWRPAMRVTQLSLRKA